MQVLNLTNWMLLQLLSAINKILSVDTYKQNAKKIAERALKTASGAKGAADKIIQVCNGTV